MAIVCLFIAILIITFPEPIKHANRVAFVAALIGLILFLLGYREIHLSQAVSVIHSALASTHFDSGWFRNLAVFHHRF